jgi:glycosyltransferase involved in cell wall biosynthesis
LIKLLQARGHKVCVIAPRDDYTDALTQLAVKYYPIDFSQRRLNPFREIVTIFRLICLYRREKPSVVHHFTIKCVLYGTLATRILGKIKVVNTITGMGHVFTDSGVKALFLRKIVEKMYSFILSHPSNRVIFQNSEDLNTFVKKGLVDASRCYLIKGSGVNCERFKPPDEKTRHRDEVVRILFASRLLKEKGLEEYLEAARLLKNKRDNVEFLLAGDIYPANPSSLTPNDVKIIKKEEGVVTFLGHVDDIRSLLMDADIVVLPSYHEGCPRILIEAAAMEKPIVATNIPGCNGLVRNDVNGFLVPVKDAQSLADAIEVLVLDKEKREQFGKAGRKIVLDEFEEGIVLGKTLRVYHELYCSPTVKPSTPNC